MHVRFRTTGLLLLATLAIAGLPGCQGIYHEAIDGHPAFPPAGMLPPAGQAIVAAAPYQSAASSATNAAGFLPPPMCQAVIAYEDPFWVAPSSNPIPPSTKVTSDTHFKFRDGCIETYVGVIDYQYDQYKRDIYTLVGSFKATGDALQSLASAGAAGIGGSAAQILSGISAGIGALNTGIDNQVLYKNTIVALISQMDADRKEQLGIILQRMGPDSKTKPLYSMYAASVDLLGYFDAGTVAHALASMQKSSGAKATNCQAQVNNLKTTGTKTGAKAGAKPDAALPPSNPAAQPGAC